MIEVWEDVIGFEGIYKVSNTGKVLSLNYNHTGKPKELKQPLASSGYPRIVLCKNKKKKGYMTHQVVAMAFLGHTPNGRKIIVDHIDEDKTNCSADNLQLLTVRQNTCKSLDKSKTVSKYIGVSKAWGKKWRARITINGKLKHLGYFGTEKKASESYINAVNKLNTEI